MFEERIYFSLTKQQGARWEKFGEGKIVFSEKNTNLPKECWEKCVHTRGLVISLPSNEVDIGEVIGVMQTKVYGKDAIKAFLKKVKVKKDM